ncbi:MAG: chemotaxis protein CheX [Gemmatimonadaceae bacterium]|nr:chemotaxis protein CheX [Gemmatimonadaceae bacterium]
MQQLDAAIDGIVASVWESMLGMVVEPDDTIQPLGHDPVSEHTYAGVVQIGGAWDGAVAVQCSDRMARHAAQHMFSLEHGDVSVADLQDALGELTNMTGGNIKALLPEPCRLGLPVVVEGADYRLRLPGASVVRRATYRADGELVVVTMLERTT